MKLLVFLLLLVCATTIYAKRDVDMKSFNQLMRENIDQTLKDNPQVYEKKDISRKPASFDNKQLEKEKANEEQAEKLEGFQDQMSQGRHQW